MGKFFQKDRGDGSGVFNPKFSQESVSRIDQGAVVEDGSIKLQEGKGSFYGADGPGCGNGKENTALLQAGQNGVCKWGDGFVIF